MGQIQSSKRRSDTQATQRSKQGVQSSEHEKPGTVERQTQRWWQISSKQIKARALPSKKQKTSNPNVADAPATKRVTHATPPTTRSISKTAAQTPSNVYNAQQKKALTTSLKYGTKPLQRANSTTSTSGARQVTHSKPMLERASVGNGDNTMVLSEQSSGSNSSDVTIESVVRYRKSVPPTRVWK